MGCGYLGVFCQAVEVLTMYGISVWRPKAHSDFKLNMWRVSSFPEESIHCFSQATVPLQVNSPFCAGHKLPWPTFYLPTSKMCNHSVAERSHPVWKLWQPRVGCGGVWLAITVRRQTESRDFRPNPSEATQRSSNQHKKEGQRTHDTVIVHLLTPSTTQL